MCESRIRERGGEWGKQVATTDAHHRPVRVHAQIHTHTHTHTRDRSTHAHTYAGHTHTHTHTRTQHAHTHTHTHTHLRTRCLWTGQHSSVREQLKTSLHTQPYCMPSVGCTRACSARRSRKKHFNGTVDPTRDQCLLETGQRNLPNKAGSERSL